MISCIMRPWNLGGKYNIDFDICRENMKNTWHHNCRNLPEWSAGNRRNMTETTMSFNLYSIYVMIWHVWIRIMIIYLVIALFSQDVFLYEPQEINITVILVSLEKKYEKHLWHHKCWKLPDSVKTPGIFRNLTETTMSFNLYSIYAMIWHVCIRIVIYYQVIPLLFHYILFMGGRGTSGGQ